MIEATLNPECLTLKVPESCSKQSVRIEWHSYIIEMDSEEFAKKCFQSLREWIPLEKTTPGLCTKTYLVTNDDAFVKKEKYWSAYWNGEFFIDDRGRQYHVTRWKEIESDADFDPGFYRSKKLRDLDKPVEPINWKENLNEKVNGYHHEEALQYAAK